MAKRDNGQVLPTTAVRNRSLRTACPIGIAAKRRKWPAISNPGRRNHKSYEISNLGGGWGGIRTHEERKPLPVFKTGAFNRSATHPSPEIGYLVTRHTARKGGLAPQNSRS